MAAQGYSVIAIDYRHAPKYKFPAQLEDVRAALQYIQAHADNLEVDTERMAVMGRSAGGHLATLAAYQENAIPFRAVVSYYGPSDLTEGFHDPPFPNPINTHTVLRNFLGGTPDELSELYKQASPKSYVRPTLPPSLLIYGGRDHVVQSKFGRGLYSQLQATGNRAVWLEIPWAEHAFDAVFPGVSNQLALYYTERFIASMLYP
jgi:acetyl esterase/lipase